MSTKTVTAKKHVAGRQPESATLRNVLIQRDACTSDLCTEEILFGLGGGIGCAYFLFDMHGGHPVYIGYRIHAKEGDTPYFTLQMTEGWGATANVRHSSSPSAATKSLVKILNDGFTPIVWVEVTKLPYMFLSGHANAYHQVVVYGMEGDDVLVGDFCDSVIRMSMEELTEARNSNFAPRFRTVVITEATAKPQLRETLSDRIRGTCSQMLEGLGIANFGLTALNKWAHMLTNTKNKKGWPNCFPGGPPLHGAMSTVFEQIELRGYGGSAFRGMYADFLDQAAGVLKKSALKKVAEQFRESEASWRAISDAALPDSIPLLKETREALTRRSVLIRKPRTTAIDKELESLRDRLKQLRERSAKELSLSKADTLDLFGAISERVLETEKIERAAFTEL
ncbi:MAG: BtrH N-terminal domain-containing protein, partial [Pyrinomonadaceae bacterium]|nr:BtrH N-terminal domain-containing protein [Pyrinomonadaceae bacterium]